MLGCVCGDCLSCCGAGFCWVIVRGGGGVRIAKNQMPSAIAAAGISVIALPRSVSLLSANIALPTPRAIVSLPALTATPALFIAGTEAAIPRVIPLAGRMIASAIPRASIVRAAPMPKITARMPRITADTKVPTSRAISRPGTIKARAVPRTIALAIADNAAAVAIPARRNVCLLSRFGRVAIVSGRVFVGGRVLTGGVVARVFVLYSVLTVALVDGNWSQLPNLEAVLAAGSV